MEEFELQAEVVIEGPMEVLAIGDRDVLFRPCVDCGLRTGCYCDYCLAEDRDPNNKWAKGQHTPLCATCDHKYDRCHYCRGQHWAAPPATGK